MNIKNYKLLDDLVVRTPSLILSDNVIDFDKKKILQVYKLIRGALLISSKTLCNQLDKFESLDDKEKRQCTISLYKYFSRMCSRPTPFGLFSGIYCTQWGNDNHVEISKDLKARISLGGKTVNEIYLNLISSKNILDRVILYKNDTFHKKNSRISIIQKTYTDHSNYNYSIKEFSASKEDAISNVYNFIGAGKPYKEVTNYIAGFGYSSDQTSKFLNQLIITNLLTTSIDPIPNASQYLKLLDTLFVRKSEIKDIRFLKERIAEINSLKHIDEKELREFENNLVEIFPKLTSERNLVKVDLNGVSKPEKIPQKYIKCLHDAFYIMNKMGNNSSNPLLDRFKYEFNKRFDENFISILDVFDPVRGIKYLGDIKTIETPLLNDDIFINSSNQSQFSLSKNEQILLRLLFQVTSEGKTELKLSDKLFDVSLGNFEFPDSFQAWFNIIDEKNIKLINFKGNASFLLSRFTENQQIKRIQDEIVVREDELYDDKILAEVVHIPEDIRAFGIINNTEVRKYIIPIVSNSYYFKDRNIIYLNDILVTVRENKIILYSKKHKKQIIPRLTSAVFPTNVSTLPIYRFLADLNHDENKRFSFKWPRVIRSLQLDFLPRVKYKNVVLSPATWTLNKSDFVFDERIESFKRSLINIRSKQKIPQFVVLVDGENGLFLNLENYPLIFMIFKKEFNKADDMQVEEYLYHPTFKKENEIIAFFTKKIADQNSTHLTRKYEQIKYFSPISEWVNYQIYASENYVETILSSVEFRSVIERLIHQELIQKWFFVRYTDEDGFHLRLRFNCINPKESHNEILSIMSNYLDLAGIADYKLVPYKREINRYKGANIDFSEELFFHQSELVISLIHLFREKNDENLRWIIGVKLIDVLLVQFNFSPEEKVEITNIMKTGFNNEFSIKRNGYRDFNRKYKKNRNLLDVTIKGTLFEEFKAPVQQYIINSKETIASIVNNLLGEDRFEIVGSYIHMALNKLFVSLPRHHEVYVYNIINSYYREKMYSGQA